MSSEAFYLPEALIGLIATTGHHSRELDEQIISQVHQAIIYCCQDKNRKRNLASETITFYANWQFQLLYHFIHKKFGEKTITSVETNHLTTLLNALMDARLSQIPFDNHVATVEVACYLEGLVHAKQSLQMINLFSKLCDDWFENEINRSIQFLYPLQTETLPIIKGGFVHYRDSNEARIDVAGHVFGGLSGL
jgi:hypothetical protein